MQTSAYRRSLFVAAVALCLFGGIYLGLYSCGGVMWHRDAIVGVAIVLVAAACIWPADFWRPWTRRVLLPLAMVLLFHVAQGAAATVYAPPLTWQQGLHEFAANVLDGPC